MCNFKDPVFIDKFRDQNCYSITYVNENTFFKLSTGKKYGFFGKKKHFRLVSSYSNKIFTHKQCFSRNMTTRFI